MSALQTGLFEVESERNGGNLGDVETAYAEQIQALEKTGVMGEAHSGIKALVLRAARAVDRIKVTDAASGQAQLLKALNDVAAQLPQPKTADVSVIDALRAILDGDDE